MKNLRRIAVTMFLAVVISVSMIATANSWIGYVKPAFPDYVPSGMPDFDEKQDAWGPAAGIYTWCSPVAVANSLWWLDSEYESIVNPLPVPPPAISDHFNLVTAYGPWDDHDPQNVDPLVRNLAFLMDTDGIRTGDGHTGTRWNDAVNGIRQYLIQQGVAGMFEVHDVAFPTFAWIENETEVCQDVEISLEFWRFTGIWQKLYDNPSLELGHTVTCAGVNSTASELLISDPWQDAFEAGTDLKGRSPVPHAYPHASPVHNDAQYVSQDAYQVAPWNIQPPPPGYPPTVYELVGYLQTMGYDPTYHAFINAAVATSPAGVHDVAVTNVTTSKYGCQPMETVGKGMTCRIDVTVENQGDFAETFGVTAFADTNVIGSQLVTLGSGSSTVVTFTWDTTSYSFGSRTISAQADIVAGETDTGDNTFTDGIIRVCLVGDVNGDTKVDLKDVYAVGKAFGTTRQGPNPPGRAYSPNLDINDDDKIDLKDYYATTKNFGKTEP